MELAVFAIGLGLALAGPALLLFGFRTAGRDTAGGPPRSLLWALALIVILIAAWLAGGLAPGLIELGLGPPGFVSLSWGIIGAVGVLVAGAATFLALRALRLPAGDRERLERLSGLPFAQRFFLVLTAAVTEEIFYRGFGQGIGETYLGSYGAAGLSLAAFTLAHFGWRLSHLPGVFAAGSVLTLVFLQTGDLWACIIAHFAVDAAGLLIAPAFRNGAGSK